MAAEVHMIARRQKNSVRRVFELVFPHPISIVEWRLDHRVATRSASSTNHSPSRNLVVDRLPKAECLGLSQRGTLLTKAAPW
jgi:hypothetical protein